VGGYERLSPGLASHVGFSGSIRGAVRTLTDIVMYSILYPGIWVLILGVMVVIVLGRRFRLGRSESSGRD
jgi:hypothetical protein